MASTSIPEPSPRQIKISSDHEKFRYPSTYLESLGLLDVPNHQAASLAADQSVLPVQPWDNGFHLAAQDWNRHVTQRLLDALTLKQSHIEKKQAEEQLQVDDNNNNNDASSDLKAESISLESLRESVSTLRLSTAETLRMMETCVVSFINVFCPPSPLEISKELKSLHQTESEHPESEQEGLEQSDQDANLHPAVPWSLVEQFWCHTLSSQTFDDPEIIRLFNLAHSIFDSADKDSTTKFPRSLVKYLRDALVEAQVIVDMESPQHPSQEGQSFVQLKQTAANHVWPAKFLAVQSLKRTGHKTEAKSAIKSMRQDALESNQDFLRILDEALVSVSTREALESVSTSTSDEHVQDARLDEETIQDTASAKTQTTPDTSTVYLISKTPANQGLDELYAIENYTMHAFRVISIILNNSSENSLEQAFMYTKSRLNYWLANPKFMKLRIGLYMHEDDVPERQILENGLFYLDACTRLLHLTRNKDDSPILRKWLKDADMDEAYNVFLASHSELEQLLTVSWENTIKPVLAGTIDMNNKQESRSKTVAMEGTLAIRKRRYQKIIDDYRRRKQEREQIIKDGDKTTSTQTSRTSHKSSRSANDAPESKEEKDASPDVQDDEVKTAVDQQIKAPIKSKTEITVRNEPEEQLTKPNDEGKFLSERILKIAIGVGRLLHSIAMSTGRNTLSENDTTIDAPWSASAVDLEQRLYEKAYATFKMTASFQEQNAHAQFPSVSSSQNAIVDANMAEHHLHSSDMFVQNQLDIADTLSCLGFVLDTKRKKYEAALSSYKRAVEIYTFFMGDKSEAAEKAWHNIGILHVALSSRKDGDSKGHIEEPQASPHEESSADPKHSHLDDSLDSWRHVLACQHYNHSQEGQKNVTLDHALPVAFTLEYIAKVYELKKNEQEALAAFGNSLLQVQRVLNAEDKQNLNVSEALSTRDRLLHKIFQIMYKRREFEKICQLIVDHFVDTTSFIDYFSKSTNDFKLVLVGGLSLFRVGKLEDAALSLASYLTSKEYIRVCSETEETKKELADCSMLIDLSTLLSDQVSVVANVDRLKKATDRTIEACFVVATLMQTKMVENAVQCKEPPGESKKCDELIAILEALHTLMKAWKRKQESLHGEIHDVFSQYLADLHFYKGEISDVILHEMDAAFVEYKRALDLYEMRRSKIEAQMQHQSGELFKCLFGYMNLF